MIALVGPTGIGKTELALRLAESFSAEIIGVDSMQIYRYMDIGTAKSTRAEQDRVRHHLIDIVDPDEHYTVVRFAADARAAGSEITGRGNIPFLVGGTGMYLRGLLEGIFETDDSGPDHDEQEASPIREKLKKRLADEGRAGLYDELQACDPGSAARIHPNDTHRLLRALEIFQLTGIPWSRHLKKQNKGGVPQKVLKLGLTCDREQLYKQINSRVGRMLETGLLDEVKGLLDMGYDRDLKSMQSIGYRHMINYLAGDWGWDEAVELLARDTRRYAKRQFTWFKRDPEISWFDKSQDKELFDRVRSFIEKSGQE